MVNFPFMLLNYNEGIMKDMMKFLEDAMGYTQMGLIGVGLGSGEGDTTAYMVGSGSVNVEIGSLPEGQMLKTLWTNGVRGDQLVKTIGRGPGLKENVKKLFPDNTYAEVALIVQASASNSPLTGIKSVPVWTIA